MNQSTVTSHPAEQLFGALARHDLDAIALALASGASPNARNEDEVSALTSAAADGYLEGATLLIEAGANVNRRDIVAYLDIRTALHAAIRARHVDMIEHLLKRGADPRITNHEDATTAHALIESGLLDRPDDLPDCAQLLRSLEEMLKTDEVINATNMLGDTCLHLASRRDVHPKVLDLLFARGADPEMVKSFGGRAMHCLWTGNNVWKARRLVEFGTDPNSRDRSGASALSRAVDAQAVIGLLEAGADLNHLDNLGRNTLAIILDTTGRTGLPMEVATQMIAAGIDVEHKDLTGASVASRLIEMATPEAKQLQAIIIAHRAHAAMLSTIGSRRRETKATGEISSC